MQFDPYEYIGVVLPGSIVVLTASLAYPELREMLGKDGVQIGGLGIFLIASYVIGHVVQALGNGIEWADTKLRGSNASDQLLAPDQTIIAPSQRARLVKRLAEHQDVELDDLDSRAWAAIRREMYAAIAAAKATARIEAFNRTYGLLRGLSAGFLVAAGLTVIARPDRWLPALLLVAAAVLAVIRMQRFSVHYTRELIVEYLRLAPPSAAPAKLP